MEYITPAAMAAMEAGASRRGISVESLMENAGRGVAEFIVERYGEGKTVCAVCGGGNNGGDGFVAARRLSKTSRVSVVLVTRPEKIRTDEAGKNWRRLAKTDADVIIADDPRELAGASRRIVDADIVIDALLGTGAKGGQVREPYATAISMVNSAKGKKVAVDLPSGLDPETGVPGTPTVRADVTLALHMPKVGLKGRKEYTGEVLVVPIGIGGKGS